MKKLSLVRKKLERKFPNSFARLQVLFRESNKREVDRRLKGSKFELYLFKVLNITNMKQLSSKDLCSILFNVAESVCKAEGCTNLAGYDAGKRRFKEFCCKKCYNNSPENIDRRNATIKAKYGVDNPFQAEEVKAKIKATTLARFGVDNISKLESTKQKKIKKSLAKYGTAHHMQNKEFMREFVEKFRDTYGVDNPMQIAAVQEQIKATLIERYGVDNIRKDPKTKRKIVESCIRTCLERYGVPNAMQDAKVLASWRKAVANKKYVTVAGKKLVVQGYEDLAITKVAESHTIKNVTTKPNNVKLIAYTYKGKSRRYLPDFKIKLGCGKIVLLEVKSWFTLSAPSNVAKFEAALKGKHDFWLAIVEPKLDAVRLLKNPKIEHIESLCATAKLFSSDYRQIL